MMWLVLVVALVVCAVVAIGAALNTGPKPQHARPRHLEAVPDPAPEVGSMDLAAELALHGPLPVMLAAPVDPEPWRPDWREQTAADLCPEALDASPHSCCCHGGFSGEHDCCVHTDPGAGDEVSSEPPAPVPPADWLETQLADLFAWVRRQWEVPA